MGSALLHRSNLPRFVRSAVVFFAPISRNIPARLAQGLLSQRCRGAVRHRPTPHESAKEKAMTRHHQGRQRGGPEDSSYNRGYDDPLYDQRNPDPDHGSRPRHWQGQAPGDQGRWQGGPDFDRRGYGRGQQFGRAGDYGRAYEERSRQGFEGRTDRRDDDF